jgi:hypothetical protein
MTGVNRVDIHYLRTLNSSKFRASKIFKLKTMTVILVSVCHIRENKINKPLRVA